MRERSLCARLPLFFQITDGAMVFRYLRPAVKSDNEPSFSREDRQVDPPPHEVDHHSDVINVLRLVRQVLDQLASQR